MILKQRHHRGGWRYLDNIERVEDHGYITDPTARDACRVFQNIADVLAHVDQVWGTEREFAAEWYPAFPDEASPDPLAPDRPGAGVFEAYAIKPITAWLRDGRAALVLTGQETYLLADNGDTIERL